MKGYGSREFFSLGQIEASSIELSKRQQQIALALFADPLELNIEDSLAIKALRGDISNDYFGGGNYTAQDVLNLLGKGGWKGGRNDDDMSNRFGMYSRY